MLNFLFIWLALQIGQLSAASSKVYEQLWMLWICNESEESWGPTGINWSDLVLDHSNYTNSSHYSDADHLQPNVQPLRGSVTDEHTALVLIQPPFILLLEPAHLKKLGNDVYWKTSRANKEAELRDIARTYSIPGSVSAGPNCYQATESLGKVWIDWRKSEAAQAFEFTGGVSIKLLSLVV